MRKIFIIVGVPLVALFLVTGVAVWLIIYYTSPEAIPFESKLKLSIDHDGGADDAMAITTSLLYEAFFDGPKVVALTVTHGNVNVSQAVNNSARVLGLVDRLDVPVYAGASQPLISGIKSDHYFGYDGLGDNGCVLPHPPDVKKEHAAIALIELSKQYEGELIVMAIGPLTNIALAIRLDPDFINRLAHLYYGGGSIVYDYSAEPEFNAAMDPEAYYIVANASKLDKVTFVPFSQIISSLNITKEWRKDVLGAIPSPVVQALNGYERLSLAKNAEWTELDPAVAAIVLNSGVVRETKNAESSMILCDQHRAITTYNFATTEPNSRVIYSANKDIYKQFLIDVYSAELNYDHKIKKNKHACISNC